jgi:alanine or glycine:cation symporter, AGCS family
MIQSLLNHVNDVLWGVPMLVLLCGTHLFLTFRLKGIQRYLLKGIKLSFKTKKEGDGDISHFGALSTALAATVGTGNIAGVATAIAAGGPGALLWMWLTGVFGIATKYGEAVLSVKYRVTTKKGTIAGGPMYVLEKGLKCKPLGIAFAVFTAIAAFGIGNTVQSNSMATLIHESVGIVPWKSGIILAILTGLVILGGIRSIAKVCEMMVPFMTILYIGGCCTLLFIFSTEIMPALKLIGTSAFSGHAAIGGFLGASVQSALRYGIARGLFSNESGMGSAPIVAAAAQTTSPVRQALVSATGTFWDTVVICALTGLVIVASGEWTSGQSSVALSKLSFGHLPHVGSIILTVSLFFFVFSTLIGWSYYGEKAAEYLFGERIIKPYRYVWVLAVFIGAVVNVPVVWSFADTANALMAIPNLLSLLLLSGVIAKETTAYFSREKGMKS